MALINGQLAPEFEARTYTGATERLTDYRGSKLWLAFFRYAACPLCNLRVRAMIERFPDLSSRGLKIVAVFQSPASTMAEYVGQVEPPFPLLSDPEERLYALYELESSLAGFLSPKVLKYGLAAKRQGISLIGPRDGTVTRLPADFLIDEEGLLAQCFYARNIGEHISFDEIERFISC